MGRKVDTLVGLTAETVALYTADLTGQATITHDKEVADHLTMLTIILAVFGNVIIFGGAKAMQNTLRVLFGSKKNN